MTFTAEDMTKVVERFKASQDPLHFILREGPFSEEPKANLVSEVERGGGLVRGARAVDCGWRDEGFVCESTYSGELALGPLANGSWVRIWFTTDRWYADPPTRVGFSSYLIDYDPTECRFVGTCEHDWDDEDTDRCLSCEYGYDYCNAHMSHH